MLADLLQCFAGCVLWDTPLQGAADVCGGNRAVLPGHAALPGADRPPAPVGGSQIPGCQRESPV